MVTLHDILRALVGQHAGSLNDPQWQAEAHAAIDASEAAAAPQAPAGVPAGPPADTPEGGDQS